jgi:protein-S-isoprenylcysteine O-methyltransferase Ste14
MRKLELKIPPPLVFALAALITWGLSKTFPPVDLAFDTRLPLALGIAAIGGFISVAGALAFRRAKTTANPLRPHQATALVTGGIYRITRNPMYVGLMLVLLAWAVGLGSPVSLAGPVMFIMYMNRFQIGPEEAALAAKFGDEFEAYRSRVRRWI